MFIMFRDCKIQYRQNCDNDSIFSLFCDKINCENRAYSFHWNPLPKTNIRNSITISMHVNLLNGLNSITNFSFFHARQ